MERLPDVISISEAETHHFPQRPSYTFHPKYSARMTGAAR
jgi:hypothetical protein